MSALLGTRGSVTGAAATSRRQSPIDSLRTSNRRILVMGPQGVGKTTLSCSASSFAGDTIPADKPRELKDLVLIQGDMEGVAGAMGAGFIPAGVYDLSTCATWATYQKELTAALSEIRSDSSVKYVVVDLALPERLIRKELLPENQKEWGSVAQQGEALFQAFASLRGVTVIGNAQLKASASPGETSDARNASNVRAVGGERSTYSMDLCKGVGAIWSHNASLVITRTVKREKAGNVYSSLTQSTMQYEAKSRFHKALLPVEDGSRSLHSMLKAAYGEAL